MAEPYLGEIRPFAFARAPTDWLPCDGAILNVRDYQALYSLLGNRYGGDGKRTFALPDLRGRTPIGLGTRQGKETTYFLLGAAGGAESVRLGEHQVIAHTHPVAVQGGDANAGTPKGNFLANAKETTAPRLPTYAKPGTTVSLDNASVTTTGSGEPVTIRQPYQALVYCISIRGDYPPRAD